MYHYQTGIILRLFIITIIFLSTQVNAQQGSNTYFTFGDNKMDRGKLISVQGTNSIFIAGETEDTASANKLVFITKMTSGGKISWYKTFGGDISYAVNSWSLTNDGGFILSAEQYYKNDKETLYLVKADTNGNIQWSKLFDEGGNEVEGLSIVQSKDGGFVVTGLIKVRTVVSSVFVTMKEEKQYLYVLKTDKNGNKEWSKKFNYEDGGVATGNKVVETDMGYLIGGIMGIINGENGEEKNADMLLIHLDKKGNLIWGKRLGGPKNESIKTIGLIDGDVFVAGTTTSAGEGKSDAYLARLSLAGNLKWFKTYGGIGHENASTIVELDKSTLLVAGETNSFGNGAYDLFLLTLTKEGALLNAETFGQKDHDELGSAVVSGTTVFATGFSFISKERKSAQAYLLSFEGGTKNNTCFYMPASVVSKNHVNVFSIKELGKQLLTDVPPAPEKTEPPFYKTITKNKLMVVEPFCK